MSSRPFVLRLFVVVLSVGAGAIALGAACGASRWKAPPNPPRIPDSVPEKAAATRNASPQQLHLEAEDNFWNIEADKEYKRIKKEDKEAKQERATNQALIPMPRMGQPDAGVAPGEKDKP